MATGGAPGPGYPVLVWVPESFPGLEKKLLKYFQSPKKSGGGECTVKAGPSEATFWIEFLEREVKERVIAKKEHTVEVSTALHVKVFVETDENLGEKYTLETTQLYSQTQSLLKESPEEKLPEERGASSSPHSFIQKIFLLVEAHLEFNLSKKQKKKIINLCPNLKIERGHDGTEKLIGDYQDIEKIYHLLSESALGNDQKEDFPHSTSGREIKNIMPNDSENPILHSKPKHRTEESDFLSVPSHLYEYFKYFFAETLDRIEKIYKVRITSTLSNHSDTTYIDFETSKAGDRKAAQEAFAQAFQREIQNVNSEEVHCTDSKLALECQRLLTSMFKNLHIKVEEKVLILQGNPTDILTAKRLIEKRISCKKPVKIMVSQNIKKEIEVDSAHLHFLHQEMIEIEKKYDIAIELMNNPQTGKTHIVFKAKDSGLDLSVHAYEYFIDVFQMISAQIIREVVILKPLDQDRKHWFETTFFADFERQHPHVKLERNEQKLTLTGLLKYLAEAMKYIKKYFSTEDPFQQRAALSFGGNWSEDSNSPLHKKNGDDFKMTLLSSKGLPSIGNLEKEKKEEECAICMDIIQHKQVLSKCKHSFCGPCIKKAMTHKPVCPVCQTFYGIMKGNQPEGKMEFSYVAFSLPGYPSCNTIEIRYDMKGGIQTNEHPNPGSPYSGTRRTAYLPNNQEGRHVLKLLRRAFEQKLIFTIGQSRTSGINSAITWNDIHHKTQRNGGPENFGYPDPTYLNRVKLELQAKGIE
ncbi:E3 ubiquitin-protein ligase DTX3L [Macrotis lagotis]|uniref:E3 ubiquitin-protein ligase DTX3L n=1 Tax=Macrotis lagotis TaxID=92651 RepID=UPI003D68B6E8